MRAPRGTLIAYATAPDDVADDNTGGANGLYTTELLKHLAKPGQKIEDVFKAVLEDVMEASGGRQQPWNESSIIGNLYLVKGNAPPKRTDIPPPVVVMPESIAEAEPPPAPIPSFKPSVAKISLTLKGHTAPINGAAFSPDGKRVVTASEDGTAKVWDTITGEELITFNGHRGRVTSAAFSPDGVRIISTGEGVMKIWDAATGRERTVIKAQEDYSFQYAAFSPDGKRILTDSGGAKAKIWSISTKKEITSLVGHTDFVHEGAFSRDGKYVVTASSDSTAKIWDATTGKERITLKGHEGNVESVAFNSDGERVLTASGDLTAKIWDVATGDVLTTIKLEYSGNHTAFSRDGKYIMVNRNIYDSTTGRRLITLEIADSYVIGLAYSQDGRHVITQSDGYVAMIWLLE